MAALVAASIIPGQRRVRLLFAAAHVKSEIRSTKSTRLSSSQAETNTNAPNLKFKTIES
jgi:hypothetical protein